MTKQDYIEIIKLLSALESVGVMKGMPNYLGEDIAEAIEKLTHEVCKE